MGDPRTDPNSPLGRVGARWADNLQEGFRREVANLLGRSSDRFPGAQPVSFSAKHLQELKERDYWVCEKTDGERFLLWMTNDGPNPLVYFINRKNDYYYVPGFIFPHHVPGQDFHRDTILDGELVEDRHPDGRIELNFLVFDMLVLDGKTMMQRTLDKRMAYFKEQVLKPYGKTGQGPFPVKDKEIQFAYAMDMMFKEVIPRAKKVHGNDGMIFTCKDTEYHPGTDPHILKWKPPEENTVDFLLHIRWEKHDFEGMGDAEPDFDAFPAAFELWIFNGDRGGEAVYIREGDLYVTHDEWEQWKRMGMPLQDQIVECFQEDPTALNGHGNGNAQVNGYSGQHQVRWRYHRFRHDKTDANHKSTYDSVIVSIRDRVTEADLLKEQVQIRDSWKQRQAQQGQLR